MSLRISVVWVIINFVIRASIFFLQNYQFPSKFVWERKRHEKELGLKKHNSEARFWRAFQIMNVWKALNNFVSKMKRKRSKSFCHEKKNPLPKPSHLSKLWSTDLLVAGFLSEATHMGPQTTSTTPEDLSIQSTRCSCNFAPNLWSAMVPIDRPLNISYSIFDHCQRTTDIRKGMRMRLKCKMIWHFFFIFKKCYQWQQMSNLVKFFSSICTFCLIA